MRTSQFTVDASDVQGVEGATVTFRCVTLGEWKEYQSPSVTDVDLVRAHLIHWSGFVDDDGNSLPDPTDEPEVMDGLYIQENRALARLLWRGPLEDTPKN